MAGGAWAAEGMWTLDHPPLERMRSELGWAPDEAWLTKAMHASARIGNGCSASFVSKDGLVLTNHHCVSGCIDQLSTADANLLAAGFLANDRAAEKQCPALEVSRLERITDVTSDVKTATAGRDGTSFVEARNAVEARLAAACVGDAPDRVRCDVVSLYHGGQYKLYRYRRFRDVRLAFAPEQASASFGGDPDNFNFPRFDLDMALVRVYEDGRPIGVTEFFAIDARGPAAGDAVFVTGHPGSTQRELTVAQLASQRDVIVLDALLRRTEYRGLLTEWRETGAEADRIAVNELNGVENGIKVLRGQLTTLLSPDLFRRKEADEAALRRYVDAHPALAAQAGGAWDAIRAAEVVHRELYQPYVQLERGNGFDNRYFAFARLLVRGAAERAKPDEARLPEFNERMLPQVRARLVAATPIHPALEQLKLAFALTQLRERLGPDAPIVRAVLGRQSPKQLASALIVATKLGDPAVRQRLWDEGAAAIAASDDPFIRLALAVDPDARAIRARYERDVQAVIQKNTELIAQARFAAYGDTTYPDATSSLRLSYGIVAGWNEAGAAVAPFTRIGGAFDRATGAEPFALPPSWLAGRATLDPATPFNVATTHDTIGGNSGSPMLNRSGELVGLLFDGNIHSLGGAFVYDPVRSRSVSLDSAAILEALDVVYHAHALANELRGR